MENLLGRIAQSVTYLATDGSLTADPEVASSIPAWSHTFVEIDREIILRSFSSLLLNHSIGVVVSESMFTKYWLTVCSSFIRKKCS